MRRRIVALALVCFVATTGAALAARGDPQKRFTPADQARAKAMLLRKADLPRGFVASLDTPESDFYCKALDESDLTLTGEAESPNFSRVTVFIASLAQVYESVGDANASWRRGTSPAGERCIRDEFAKDSEFLSLRRLSFPRVAPLTVAYRLTGRTQGVGFYLDFAVLQRSRAQAAIVFGSAVAPVRKAEEVRLARIVAKRMATAMRGG